MAGSGKIVMPLACDVRIVGVCTLRFRGCRTTRPATRWSNGTTGSSTSCSAAAPGPRCRTTSCILSWNASLASPTGYGAASRRAWYSAACGTCAGGGRRTSPSVRRCSSGRTGTVSCAPNCSGNLVEAIAALDDPSADEIRRLTGSKLSMLRMPEPPSPQAFAAAARALQVEAARWARLRPGAELRYEWALPVTHHVPRPRDPSAPGNRRDPRRRLGGRGGSGRPGPRR